MRRTGATLLSPVFVFLDWRHIELIVHRTGATPSAQESTGLVSEHNELTVHRTGATQAMRLCQSAWEGTMNEQCAAQVQHSELHRCRAMCWHTELTVHRTDATE